MCWKGIEHEVTALPPFPHAFLPFLMLPSFPSPLLSFYPPFPALPFSCTPPPSIFPMDFLPIVSYFFFSSLFIIPPPLPSCFFLFFCLIRFSLCLLGAVFTDAQLQMAQGLTCNVVS